MISESRLRRHIQRFFVAVTFVCGLFFGGACFVSSVTPEVLRHVFQLPSNPDDQLIHVWYWWWMLGRWSYEWGFLFIISISLSVLLSGWAQARKILNAALTAALLIAIFFLFASYIDNKQNRGLSFSQRKYFDSSEGASPSQPRTEMPEPIVATTTTLDFLAENSPRAESEAFSKIDPTEDQFNQIECKLNPYSNISPSFEPLESYRYPEVMALRKFGWGFRQIGIIKDGPCLEAKLLLIYDQKCLQRKKELSEQNQQLDPEDSCAESSSEDSAFAVLRGSDFIFLLGAGQEHYDEFETQARSVFKSLRFAFDESSQLPSELLKSKPEL